MLTSLICFYFFCGLILDFLPIVPVWATFGDPADYLQQAKLDIFSKDFYMPSPKAGFSPRPFTVPLFYKLAGAEPEKIVVMQKYFYCFAIFIFVNAVLLLLKNTLVKLLYLPLAYYFFTWWVIVGFTENLLSESISMSSLFIWLASILFYLRYKTIWFFLLLLLVSLLFSFSRDTWPYIILLAALLLFFAFFKDRRLRLFFSVFVVFSAGLLAFQSHTARVGERFKVPVFNVMATRIARNPFYLEWFKNKGMPLADSLTIQLKNVDSENIWSVIPLYNSYTSPNYDTLRHWIMNRGKNEYLKFMLLHPSYFFLADQSPEQTKRIFETTENYHSHAKGYYLGVAQVLPLFPPESMVAIAIVLLLLFFMGPVKYHWPLLTPVFLMLVFPANVFLSYNADTLEVQRHLFITQVMLQLIAIVSLALITDALATWLIRRRQKSTI